MKNFKKIITMALAAVMAVSAMSASAMAEVETYSEVVHTYKINDNGERELIDVNVDIPVGATEEEKDQIYFSAAYAAVNDIVPFAANSYTKLYSQKDRPIPNSEQSGVNNDSLISTFVAAGSNGFAIKITNPTNLRSYNMGFKNQYTERIWYDLEMPIQRGVNIDFYNGRRSGSTGESFIYTQNHRYEISISGQKVNINANADLDLELYTYTSTQPAAPVKSAIPRTVNVIANGEELQITVDDKAIVFDGLKPFIDEENRTQVPVRALADMFNCQIEWNQQAREITVIDVDGSRVTARLGDNKLTADGKTIEMDTAVMVINDRAYLPMRFIAEALGLNVFWHDAADIVGNLVV